MQHHRIIRLAFAFAVGIALAVYSFQKISDPEPARQRAREEAVVLAARDLLRAAIPADDEIQVVDPLATNRVAGKVYIYPTAEGWEVSGYYRRKDEERWHPFLMRLDGNVQMVSLSVRDKDSRLQRAADSDPKLSVLP